MGRNACDAIHHSYKFSFREEYGHLFRTVQRYNMCTADMCRTVGGVILPLLGGRQVNMLVLAGIMLLMGAVCVYFIKETYAEARAVDQTVGEEI